MSKNIGIRIPDEWLERLQALADDNACTVSDVAREAIAKHIGEDRPDPVETRLSKVEQRLARVEQSLASKPDSVQQSLTLASSESSPKPKAPNVEPLAEVTGLLTTSEAFEELQRRGYTKSLGSLRRDLRLRKLRETHALGLRIDSRGAELRRSHPKDNSVRWLYFDEQ